MAENLAETVEKYFRANRTHDLKLMRSILADDVEITSQAGTVKGADACVELVDKFLTQTGGIDPQPDPFLIDGDTVAVQIQAHLAQLKEIRNLGDFFTIKNGKTTHLFIYQANTTKMA